MNSSPPQVVVIGAGPAGLTAAYELLRHGIRCTVVEQDTVVGGISRTVSHNGYLFDIGGHRFYTKVSLVEQIWREVLGDDLLTRPRLSRIYYKGNFLNYPLLPGEALRKLGVVESARCGLSFLKARLLPIRPEHDLETWITNRFGSRLFEIFFKTYTEKVWGMSCKEIGADWAAQRIQGLSLSSLLLNAIRPKRGKSDEIKTLIPEFLYPRRGPGMMWERLHQILEDAGTRIVLGARVQAIEWSPSGVGAVETTAGRFEAAQVISSMPIQNLVHALRPAAPEWLAPAARKFRYRDFVTVALFLNARHLFSDNWIYVHDPGVSVGRIQNFKNWSPEMVPDDSKSCLGLEYFCQEGDPLWASSDEDLITLATRELAQLRLAPESAVLGGAVVRMPKAYPVYDDQYKSGLSLIRKFLQQTPGLQLVGRNGMHRYNNQDHSMLTGVFAARNVMGAHYDLWEANVDEEYLEEGRVVTEAELRKLDASQPAVPGRSVTPER
ncbi:MAG: NAD(P)/FAD-dependent oxidoreductase [Acidobacteria bacterium]|nr:NAD(P)/FAD-dependent oxidoreductase [Acidobacteriota bacterium]